jgi:AbrB family looped-hinge helix DNA binding protein
MVIEGKVSSKLQVTIPARVRDALGIRPGDTILYELEGGSVRLRVLRPDIEDVLAAVWAKHDLGDLHEEMGGDAVAYVRTLRGWDETDDQR